MNLSTFKTAGRALLVAAVIGTGGLAAAPAMAQSSGSFSFQFGIGSDGNPSFGFGTGRPGRWREGYCMTNNEVRRALRFEGYRNVEILDSTRRRVHVEADRGRWEYELRVNKCNGNVTILDRDRL